jgi:hypothetical protein
VCCRKIQFFVGDFFFFLNMHAKNGEKIQLLGHFSECALGKNCDFVRFGQKIKINLDLVGMLQNFTDNYIKIHIVGLHSFVAFRINIDLF